MDQRIERPNSDDSMRIASQVLRAQQILEEAGQPDVELGNRRNLGLIQTALDQDSVNLENTFDLQCLGLLFGCIVLEAVAGMDWWIVEDEYGRDPALRFKTTDLLVFPMTMISKRVEESQAVKVHELFDSLCSQLEDIKLQNYAQC